MKFFILSLITTSAIANTFSLRESPARFELKISSDQLKYSSELLTKHISVDECNRELIKRLNTDMLNLIPRKQPEKGISYFVDDKKIILSSAAAGAAFKLDEKMMSFFSAEEKLCQK